MSNAVDKFPGAVQLREGLEGNVVQLAHVGEKDAVRRFEMLAYTGAEVQMPFFGRVVFDLAGMKASSQRMPILKDHDFRAIAGHSESVKISEKEVRITGRMSAKTDAAREIVDLADEEFPWQASVGLKVLAIEEVLAGGKTQVNGRTFEGPLVVVSQSFLKESSFVPMGADGDTEGVVLSAVLPAWHQKMEVKTMSEEKAAAALEVKAVQEEAVKAERKRMSDLKAAFDGEDSFVVAQYEAGHDVTEAKAAYCDVLTERLKASSEANEKLKADAAGEVEALAAAEQAKKDAGAGNTAVGGVTATATGGGDAVTAFQSLVAKHMPATGNDRMRATQLAVRENQDVHKAYLEAVNGCPVPYKKM